MNRLRFLASFLFYFALLLVLWSVTPWSTWWRAGVLTVSSYAGPVLHGWTLSMAPGSPVAWIRGNSRVDLAVQFDALAIGLVPTVALLLATPVRRPTLYVRRCAVAALLLFLTHVTVVVVFPLLTHYKNAVTDILGVFLGLVSFVGAPAIIWFALTLEQQKEWLRGLRA